MNNLQKKNSITEEAFSYRISKDNKVFITWYGKQVMILVGKKSEKFLSKVEKATLYEQQMIMAKITGNFKRGNEKLFKKGGK